MCHVFAGQDPVNYAFETRSVRLMGHATSVRLETRFWGVIEQLAEAVPQVGVTTAVAAAVPLLWQVPVVQVPRVPPTSSAPTE